MKTKRLSCLYHKYPGDEDEDEDDVISYLCVQLHDVGHFVPAKAHEAAVVLGTVPPHHDVGFKVRLPLHPVGRGRRPPFGKVGGGVAFGPHMIPDGRTERTDPSLKIRFS